MKNLFEQYFGVTLKSEPEEQDIHCIWHEDSRPSLSLNIETGKFHCHGCGKSGHVRELIGEQKVILESEVDRWHNMLLQEPKLIEWLKMAKGWNDATVKRYKIGHNGGRFTLPVRDAEGGLCVNMRLYSSTAQPKVLPYGEGFGDVVWFPYPPKDEERTVYLTEGESDTLLARQYGLPAYCQTGGANSWTDEMTKAVAGKNVVLLYDTDPPGRKGASKIVNAAKFAVESIKNVLLPVGSAGKDFTDWIMRGGGNVTALANCVQSTPAHVVASGAMSLENPTPMPLWEIVGAHNARKPVECDVVISSKSSTPFLIPRKFTVECCANMKMCPSCPNLSGNRSYELDWQDPSFLTMVNVPDDVLPYRIKRVVEIPLMCKLLKIRVQEYQNIERIGMLPRVDWQVVRQQHGDSIFHIRNGFFLGVGIKANENYKIRGIVIPDPNDQTAIVMVVEAEPHIENTEDLDLSVCECFRVKEVSDGTETPVHQGQAVAV